MLKKQEDVWRVDENKMNSKKWLSCLNSILQHGKLEDHEPNYDIIELFRKYLPVDTFHRILEIGAGAGVDMNVLIENGYEVEGIDLLSVNINYAKEHFNLKIQWMDMHDLKFPEGAFNGILTIQTFEHALSPFIAVSEMHRVLKHGGRIFLDVPDARDEGVWQKWHPTLLYPEQLIRLFSGVGFKLVEDFSRKHRTQLVFEKTKKEDDLKTYDDKPKGRHICEAGDCQDTAEAFCLTAKHFVCKEHHKLFHTVDGHPLRGVNIQVPWEWKK